MSMRYKRLSDYKYVDVKEYVSEYLEQHPGTIVYVGCDSQHKGRILTYATVIVLYHVGKGGHVLYNVEHVKPIKETKLRILGEVERSVATATFLQYECGIDVERVDLDINDDPIYKSNVALKEAIGWVAGMGFKYCHKPGELIATSAANNLCR
jgi:predicted RNase H-related nuclease YkuK (DUF458 family)